MTDTNKERAGRFTKKPVTIDAWLIDPANKPHPSWVHNAFAGSDIDWCPAGKGLYINTLEGHMLGGHGDYLIRGVQSELYACKAHIFAATYEPEARASLAAKAPAAPTQAEFALRALVAAGFVTQAKVDEALTLPGAPPAATGYQQALDIRTAQGWKLGGDKVPVLYTDSINGQQVCRDDVWLCATAAFAVPPAAEPVAWRYQTPTGWHATTDPSAAMRVSAHHPVEPLYTAPPAPTEQWRDIETAPRDGTEVLLWREDCGQFIGRYTSCDAFPLTQDEIDATDEETLFAKDWFTQWPQALRLEGSEVPTRWRHLPDDPAPPQGAAKGAT